MCDPKRKANMLSVYNDKKTRNIEVTPAIWQAFLL